MFHLIYFSQSEKLMQDSELLALLNQSKTSNQKHGITGMLLYLEGRFSNQTQGRFMQVLEGSERCVKEVFEHIKGDPRHHNIIVLKQSPILERSFGFWSMGFKSLTLESYKALPEYLNLSDRFLQSDELQQSSLPLNLLRSFYKINTNHNRIA